MNAYASKERKSFTNGMGHMTKITTYMVKPFEKLLLGSVGLIAMEFGMWYWGLGLIIESSNYNYGLALTYFTPRLILHQLKE